MSRDPRYQKLLNSKRWKELRAWKLRQTEGYCEICYREGWRGIDALAVDIHHIVPVESVIDQGEAAMARVCFNPNNLMALCVRHHVEIHQQSGSHTKEAVNERKQKKRIGFLQRNDPNYHPPKALGAPKVGEYVDFIEVKDDDPNKTPI